MSVRTVQVGGKSISVEEFSGRKGTWVAKLLKNISKGTPEIVQAIGEFVRSYEQANFIELDRAQARYQLGERVDRITDEDWQKSNNALRLPKSPSPAEVVMHVFPDALELAEKHVIRLLGLIAMPNDDVATHGRNHEQFEELLEEKGGKLLDEGLFDELLELAVIGGEVVHEQYTRRAEQLGDRLGNVMRLFGMKPNGPTPQTSETEQGVSETTSSSSSPTSSTDSPEPTDGMSEPSSTERAGESSPVSTTV